MDYDEALAKVRAEAAKTRERRAAAARKLPREHFVRMGRNGGHSTWAKIRSGQLTSPSPAGGAAYREQMTDQDFRDEDAKRRQHG